MCMYVCAHLWVRVSVYTCVHVFMGVCLCTSKHLHVQVCMHLCVCLYACVYACVHICMCMYLCVCMQVCVSACMRSQTSLFFKSLLEITQTTSRSRFFSVGSSHLKKNDLVIQSLQFNETINTFLLVAWIGQTSWVVHDVSLVSLACLCSVLHSLPLCPGF